MNEIVKFIEENKVLVICRGIYGEPLKMLIQSLYNGGIRMAEVTFDQADPNGIEKTKDAIALLKKEFPNMKIGSGTVMNVNQVVATKEAGGEFCLSPDVNVEVIQATKRAGLISIPGAMSATEILCANRAGADIVKIFPAGHLGLKYIKDIQGPINHVKFLAAAGVNEENFADFLEAGYIGAGISGRLLDKEVIAQGNYNELTRRAKVFVDIAQSK